MRLNEPFFKASIGMMFVDVLIAIFWLFLLSDAFFQGRELPHLLNGIDLPELPIFVSIVTILLLASLTSILTFWQRKNIMEEMPLFSTMVDRIFGTGAYSRITHRLRPVCASILSSLILATVGLYTTYEGSQDRWSYAICLGFLVFAIFMLIAYLVSKRFPPALR